MPGDGVVGLAYPDFFKKTITVESPSSPSSPSPPGNPARFFIRLISKVPISISAPEPLLSTIVPVIPPVRVLVPLATKTLSLATVKTPEELVILFVAIPPVPVGPTENLQVSDVLVVAL